MIRLLISLCIVVSMALAVSPSSIWVTASEVIVGGSAVTVAPPDPGPTVPAAPLASPAAGPTLFEEEIHDKQLQLPGPKLAPHPRKRNGGFVAPHPDLLPWSSRLAEGGQFRPPRA